MKKRFLCTVVLFILCITQFSSCQINDENESSPESSTLTSQFASEVSQNKSIPTDEPIPQEEQNIDYSKEIYSFTGTVVKASENTLRIYTEDFPDDKIVDIIIDKDKLQNYSEIKDLLNGLEDNIIIVLYDGITLDLGPPFVFANEIDIKGKANAEDIKKAQDYLAEYLSHF